MTSDNFVVIDITGEPKVIAEVSFPTALVELHEKAIHPRRTNAFRFADAIDYTQVKELERFAASPMGDAVAAHGEVRVNRQVVGFKEVKFYTLENVGAGGLSMPEQEMHTTAFWLHFPEGF